MSAERSVDIVPACFPLRTPLFQLPRCSPSKEERREPCEVAQWPVGSVEQRWRVTDPVFVPDGTLSFPYFLSFGTVEQ